MNSIFDKERNLSFQYYKILDWGILSKDEFKEKAVWNTNHPNYGKLVEQIKLLDSFNDNRIIHSLHGI